MVIGGSDGENLLTTLSNNWSERFVAEIGFAVFLTMSEGYLILILRLEGGGEE